MKNRYDSKLIFIVLLTAALTMAGVAFSASQDKPEDLSRHPVYSGYVFGKDEKTIDFATQPLATPMGVITEVMKRDMILSKGLKERGFEIRFYPFSKGPDINYFIKKGDLEVATMGDTPALTITATHDIFLTGLVKQGHSSIIAKKRIQVNDLKGMKIGYVEGTTAHYNILIALHSAGMNEKDVELIRMEPHELADALEKGKIDAFSAWEPIPSAALEKHRDYAVVQKFLNSSYILFTKAFTARHPEEVSLIMASYLRALRWMKKDEKNLIAAAAWTRNAIEEFQKKPSSATIEQISEVTKREILHIAEAPYIPKSDLEKGGNIFKAIEFLKSKGILPQTTDWEKIKTSLNREIMAEILLKPKKYKLDEFEYVN
jgi:NitT/TauT family transport system substrate-binding protein